ncbi:hypothetical protein T05_8283 [Trichinella murrelli]|uniref:Uncharacterized protein n=1 Tax=Trichinella murrelli TaxID=144512 RepID=A0A0V0T4Q8_9BILA|nr:hypothetical protein T05_8283 [Trichinella murrelli]
MEVRGGEGGEEVFSINPLGRGTQKFVYDQVGRVCWENRSKTKKPWKESAFTAESDNQSSISNLRKPVFNATCAVSVFYAN